MEIAQLEAFVRTVTEASITRAAIALQRNQSARRSTAWSALPVSPTRWGPAVNAELAVLDRGGSPVAGLFAAGADAGHVFEDVYGGGLGWALVSGVAAGRGVSSAVSG